MIDTEETQKIISNDDSNYDNDKFSKFNRRKISPLEQTGQKIFKVLSWIETKSFALISVGVGLSLTYYSNFFKVLYEHSQVDSFYFYLALFLYTLSLSIILYLSVYLPYWKNIHEAQWEEYCPNCVIIASFSGLAGMIILIICVWDVWGWLSIPLVMMIKWGFIMTVHFAPGGVIGNFVFVILLIGLLVSGFFIEHEGYMH